MERKFFIHVAMFLAIIALSKSLKLELLREEYAPLGTKLNFYREEYQNGLSTYLEPTTDCLNLPKSWQRKPLSVDTHGTCGLVCTELDCQGTCVIVIPAHGEQKLSEIKMDKKIVSAKSCFPNKK